MCLPRDPQNRERRFDIGDVLYPVSARRFSVETHQRLVGGACQQRSLQAVQHEKDTKLRRISVLAGRTGEWVGGRVGGLYGYMHGCLKI